MRRGSSASSGGIDLLIEQGVRRRFSAPAPDLERVIARVTAAAARAAQPAPEAVAASHRRGPGHRGVLPALLAAALVLGAALVFALAGEPATPAPAGGEKPRLASVWSDSLGRAVALGIGVAGLRAWQGRKGRSGRPSWDGDGDGDGARDGEVTRLWLPVTAECVADVAFDAAAGARVLVFQRGTETSGVILLPGTAEALPEGFLQRRLGGWTVAARAGPVGRDLLDGFAVQP